VAALVLKLVIFVYRESIPILKNKDQCRYILM